MFVRGDEDHHRYANGYQRHVSADEDLPLLDLDAAILYDSEAADSLREHEGAPL